MDGPYGITQVDVPGLLAGYTAQKQARLQQMLAQRQIEHQDRADELDIQRQKLMSQVFQPQQGGFAGAAASYGAPAAAAPDVHPALAPGAPQASAGIPRTDGLQVNQQALTQLRMLDPPSAEAIDKMVYAATDRQAAEITKKGEAMARVGLRLKSLPQAQWASELQAQAPYLLQSGFTQQEIAQFAQNGVTPDAVDRAIQHGQTMADLFKQAQPDVVEVDGSLVDKHTMKSVYDSPLPKVISGPNGELIPLYRPGVSSPGTQSTGQLPHPQSKQQYDALPPGTAYIGQDGTPKVKGGAGPATPRTFP